jgi:DNA-directed RNA polymerase II subunit RPB2
MEPESNILEEGNTNNIILNVEKSNETVVPIQQEQSQFQAPQQQPQEQAPQFLQQQPQQQTQFTIEQTMPIESPIDAFEQPMNAMDARKIATELIHEYFTTQQNPLTRHHIESYDQFMQRDLLNIIASYNPIIIFKNEKAARKKEEKTYKYKTEIYIGGESGKEVFIGTPTLALDQGKNIRVLYPNEARLRNLTYAVQIEATILVRITIQVPPTEDNREGLLKKEFVLEKMPLCNFPLMLHSSYCILHKKSAALLTEMGECPQDQGGYFIVDGSEKVLVTRQEGAFNTLWITHQPADDAAEYYASISSLNPKSREVKRVNFYWTREVTRTGFGKQRSIYKESTLEVSIPFCLKPIPIFVLFRALGIQSDKDILQLIFPDSENPETKLLADLLIPSINAAAPFLDTHSAVHYIKSLTKGFSVFHVLDIIHNHLFPHVEDLQGARAAYLGDCVRKILRVVKKLDTPPSKDDTRYQRLLASGFLCQMLFSNIYKQYTKMIKLEIDKKFNYNESVYMDQNFFNIFSENNRKDIFAYGFMTQAITRGFKGKWMTGTNTTEAGLLQELSRLSYLDFMSHLRRVVLNFDTGLSLVSPRQLRPSQYGYFCTSETPSGKHIGVTKNLSIMTAISTSTPSTDFVKWLFNRGKVIPCEYITPQLATSMIPVYLNSGLIGYTGYPKELSKVLRFFKRSGYLPPLSSSGFSIPERKLFIYLDDGRPLRPLIICYEEGKLPNPAVFNRKTWRDYIVGHLRQVEIGSREFLDPLADIPIVDLKKYIHYFEERIDKMAIIEYIDPFEQNEALIANYPEHVIKQTTHMEVHPSTIVGLLGNMIPYPNHNQSPRNQLSSSQSKQGLSLYATNFQNRFDNTANILCYGQAPLSRTIYQDYIGESKMSYGQNVILAMGMYGGYNQEDGIIMNADALARGQFRSINYRSYETFEEDDPLAQTQTRIGNPKMIPGWMNLNPMYDYRKLDENGIIRQGEYVDQNTVLVGRYMIGEGGTMKDASLTPQVWTTGRVEKVVVMMNNAGMKMVKIRITQDRVPQLGDKFCLSEDHEVLTTDGWKPIADITTDDLVLQYNPYDNQTSFVNPEDTMVFEHTDEMYEIQTENGSQYVTPEHKVYCKNDDKLEGYDLIKAEELYMYYLNKKSYFVLSDTLQDIPITSIKYTRSNEKGNKVYCITVPTSIFLIRRKQPNEEQEPFTAVWTGNSNRHGQKGTINVLYRGHDMPRTADGIVPDMIMNPTAIPSRMTIGQILEMMLGNVAANIGAIGNCTAFMNDGSPHEMLGKILEGLGMHKLCNQVLYNGMTGEQIEADIYMGVVYGMRLKHMTDDKWNARGQGRKEQRTRQPTGGRGNEGGLKIGEMDRDSIVAHGISSFAQESYTVRSDGSTFYVCDGCGTIPIYNEKQNLYLCPSCDGPIEYSGDNATTLEPIPPATRSSTTFSKVEFPYATKLLFQEMETYLNMSMRILTTKHTSRLNGISSIQEVNEANAEGITQPLPSISAPETQVPELPPKVKSLTAAEINKQLASLQQEQEKSVNTFQAQQPQQQPLLDTRSIVSLPPINTTPNLPPQAVIPSFLPTASADGAVVAETEEGIPIIQVNTDASAMKESGLVMPSDSTKPIITSTPHFQDYAPSPRRIIRRKPQFSQQQYAPQQPYEPQQYAQQPPQQYEQQGGGQDQAPQSHGPQAPVKVVKLG